MSLYDFSRHISELKRNKQFGDALAYFKENKAEFSEEQVAKNEFVISDMLYCLRGANYFDAGFKFLSTYNIQIGEATPERILTAYGWLLWSTYKNENDVSDNNHQLEDYHFDDESEDINHFHNHKSELISKIETLIPLLQEQGSQFSQTVMSNLFSIVLKSEKVKPNPNWQLIDDFCNHFPPNELSTKCETIRVTRKGRQVDMELASDRENWYAYKTKALQKLNRWQACFDLSKEALNEVSKFHYSNDVWFSRRIALSKKNLGSPEETVAELLKILKKKKEWFIQKELAEIYFEQNNIELAHKYAMEAVNNFGPLEFKIDLLFLLGKVFLAKDKKDLAFKHFSLSKLVRLTQDPPWKVPQKLHDELRTFEHPEITSSDIKNLEAELKGVWGESAPVRQATPKSGPGNGVVKVILHDNEKGKDGFLTSEKTDYYFNIYSNDPLVSKVIVKAKVSFKVLPSNQTNKPRAKITKVLDWC